MYKRFKKSVQEFDTFGVEVKLNLNGEQYYQSYIGGLITILAYGLIIAISISGIVSLIIGNDFTVNNIMTKVQTTNRVTVDFPVQSVGQDFMMGFQVVAPIPSGKRFYEIFLISVNASYSQDGTKTINQGKAIPLEQCSIDHFLPFLTKELYSSILFAADIIKNYHCLPLNANLTLQGSYNSQQFQYAQVIIRVCTDSDCYSEQELRTFMTGQSILINTITSNTISDLYSDQNIYKYVDTDYYVQTTLDTINTISNLYLQRRDLTIDNSVFRFQSSVEKQTIYTTEKIQPSQTVTSDFNSIWTLNIRGSQVYGQDHKSFSKFNDLLSYIGGIAKFFMSFFGFLIIKYNQTGLQIKLANSLYQFDIPVQQSGNSITVTQELKQVIQAQIYKINEITTKFKHGVKLITTRFKSLKTFGVTNPASIKYIDSDDFSFQKLTTNRNSDQVSDAPVIHKHTHTHNKHHSHEDHHYLDEKLQQIEEAKQSILTTIIDQIIKSKQKVEFGLGLLISNFMSFCQKDKHAMIMKQLVTQSQKMIDRDLDILAIMDKLQEMSKMKQILLDHHQQQVFNCLPKPVITVIENDDSRDQDESPPLEYNQVATIVIDNINEKKTRQTLLGVRHKFDNKEQLVKLYAAYETVKQMKNEKHKLEIETINDRIIALLEPSIQVTFKSLGQLGEISDQIKNKIQTQQQKKAHSHQINNIPESLHDIQLTFNPDQSSNQVQKDPSIVFKQRKPYLEQKANDIEADDDYQFT